MIPHEFDRQWDIAACRRALAGASARTHGFRVSRERMEALIAEIDELAAMLDTWREVANSAIRERDAALNWRWRCANCGGEVDTLASSAQQDHDIISDIPPDWGGNPPHILERP